MSKNIKAIKEKGNIINLLLFIILIVVLSIGIIKDKHENKTIKTEKEDKVSQSKIDSKKIFNNMTLTTFGDSVTQGNTWQPNVVKELGFKTYTNLGVAGTRVSGEVENAMWKDERIDKIPVDSNVIMFMGGTNDWGQNIKLGSIDNKDTDTFYGALNVIADKLTTKFPKAKIIFMSTTFAKNTNRGIFTDKTGIVNSLGLKNIDYGLATKKVAETRHITFIDLTNLWDEKNIKDYVGNENDAYIHPNEKGGELMAQTIVNDLRKEAGVK